MWRGYERLFNILICIFAYLHDSFVQTKEAHLMTNTPLKYRILTCFRVSEDEGDDSATVTAEGGTRLSRELANFIFVQKSNTPRSSDGEDDDDEGRGGAPPNRKGGRRALSRPPEMRITADREEDEASVAAFVDVLKAANGGGGGGKSRGRGNKYFVGDTE